MLKLAAVFENAAGKNHSWSFNDPDPNKSPEDIKSALDAMTTIHLFEKDGIRQFCKVVSAKFVETIETPLFDLSKPTPEAYVADPNNIFAAHIISEEAPQVSEKPVVDEVKEVAGKEKSAIPPKAAPVPQKLNSIEKKPTVAPSSLKTHVANPESLTAVVEQAKKNSMMPSTSAQQLEALTADSESSKSDSPTVQKPLNSRKAQVDRIRAYHEAQKKKKKGKKKKR
ncbi:DUF2922 domain-containing protein [Enterococcus pallens]|uniref:DUF2922 family protein n=1 Tax=Enterococcus pallens ATCC BAA-351 TaxID=1158607 RepID=R2SMM4_9ENTE|nr:DUF2922 domain-containing protein [Enterococcus pallens]EOH94141.1 hypothetical protein UAU_01876 [Enterococcus pallens ATCC BAA-351]EOU24020.1 hypothetical protein I588_00007 [Enterococcus pallens ATCC BAA-351]OJG69363.1 hypothetical protein RV10_GL001044 [Enterococcus pallens]